MENRAQRRARESDELRFGKVQEKKEELPMIAWAVLMFGRSTSLGSAVSVGSQHLSFPYDQGEHYARVQQERLEMLRRDRLAALPAWLEKATHQGELPHIVGKDHVFVPCSPCWNGKIRMKVYFLQGHEPHRGENLPMVGVERIHDEDLAAAWGQVPIHQRMRMMAAVRHRTLRGKKPKGDGE